MSLLVVSITSLILFVVCDEKSTNENPYEKTNLNHMKIGGQERVVRQMAYPSGTSNKRYTGWVGSNNKQYDNRYNLNPLNNPYNELNLYNRRQAFFPLKNRNPIRTYSNPTQNTFQNRLPSNRRPTVTRRPSGNIVSTRTSKKPVSKKKFKPSFIMV